MMNPPRMYVFTLFVYLRKNTNGQVMFSTTLEVEKQLQQVIKQLYEKVSFCIRVADHS